MDEWYLSESKGLGCEERRERSKGWKRWGIAAAPALAGRGRGKRERGEEGGGWIWAEVEYEYEN